MKTYFKWDAHHSKSSNCRFCSKRAGSDKIIQHFEPLTLSGDCFGNSVTGGLKRGKEEQSSQTVGLPCVL